MTQYNRSQVISNRIVNESYLMQGFRALGIELEEINDKGNQFFELKEIYLFKND